jgi:hypothetical protein
MQSTLGLSSDWALYLFILINYLHLSRVRVVCSESGRSLRTVLGLLVVQLWGTLKYSLNRGCFAGANPVHKVPGL